MEYNKETRYRFDGESLLREVAPDKKFYVRIRQKHEEGEAKFKYIPAKVASVWVSGGPHDFFLHVEKKWGAISNFMEDRFPISEEDYKLFQRKDGTYRLKLLSKASGGNIVIRKNVASKHIDIRVTPELYAKLANDAEKCNMPLSDYCREHLKGKRPRAALDDAERELVNKTERLCSHLSRFSSAMKGVLKEMSPDERLHYIMFGKSFEEYRKYIDQAVKLLNNFLLDR